MTISGFFSGCIAASMVAPLFERLNDFFVPGIWSEKEQLALQ
jgi:hypothetical protein